MNVNKTLLKAKSLVNKGELEAAIRNCLLLSLRHFPKIDRPPRAWRQLSKRDPRWRWVIRRCFSMSCKTCSDCSTRVISRKLWTWDKDWHRATPLNQWFTTYWARLTHVFEIMSARLPVTLPQSDYSPTMQRPIIIWVLPGNEIGRHQEAIESYVMPSSLSPAFSRPITTWVMHLQTKASWMTAIASYGAAISIKPDFEMASALRACSS